VQEIALELEAMVARFAVYLVQEMHYEGLSGAEEEGAAVLKSADPASQVVKTAPCQVAEAGREEVSG
jgi:hypothetical protein